MGRPKKFIREDVLHSAMRVFWEHGYTASSMQMLLDAMGLNRGSFYESFNDKATLFRDVLDVYQKRIQIAVLKLLDADSFPFLTAQQRLQQMFDVTLLNLPEPERKLGCLLVNTVTEMAVVDSKMAKLAGKKLVRLHKALSNLFEQAASRMELLAAVDPDSATELVFTCINGLRVQARRDADLDRMKKTVDTLMLLLFGAPNK